MRVNTGTGRNTERRRKYQRREGVKKFSRFCKCCGEQFETDNPKAFFKHGHNKARQERAKRLGFSGDEPFNPETFVPKSRTFPSMDDVLKRKPESCGKCGNRILERDDIDSFDPKVTLPDMARVEWRCVICGKRHHGVNFLTYSFDEV